MTATASHPRMQKSDAEWRNELTPEQYHVTRQQGTERAFTGPYWNEKRAGTRPTLLHERHRSRFRACVRCQNR
jgi:peptide methionine sulfoxide reductase MsrB